MALTPEGALVIDDSQEWPDDREYHEVYLRVVDLDLDQEEQVLDFAQRYGPMGAALGVGVLEHGRYAGLTNATFLERVRPKLEAARRKALITRDPWPDHYTLYESLEDFRWGATCIRDLFRAWRLCRDGLRPERWESPIWDNPVLVQDEGSGRGWDLPPQTPDEAAELLQWGMRDGLSPFQPQLRTAEASPQIYSGQYLPIFFLCHLELFNHIVEDAAYKICKNHTCGRLFVRQEGRAVHGQHRTKGVKYCSKKCAGAVASRALRRRERDRG